MRKIQKYILLLFLTVFACHFAAGCANVLSQPNTKAPIDDGIYTVDFDTDGSMFHVNEACNGKGMLTVKNGEMTLHISLPSKNIVNLYVGLADDAQKEDAVLLNPTMDTVTYSDGTTEEVHGFDIPVTIIDEEFDVAILGTKGKWYDHKVKISNPEISNSNKEGMGDIAHTSLENGKYLVNVSLEGGSGRASILNPVAINVTDGKALAKIEWSSPNYDYMKIENEMYYPINTEGNSVFEIPIDVTKNKISVTADTIAMGTPHEIEYTIIFYFDEIINENTSSINLEYAEGFTVENYDNGCTLISIPDSGKFMLIPENTENPENLSEDTIVLRKPVDNVYLAASAVMDMFVSLDSVNNITLSGIKQDGWYIDEAKTAMETGKIKYAGKYNMPDYEEIVSSGCNLAIESTMILHSPEVKENLEKFGIPVLIDRSSYEKHPLGRMEWVKLYGALLGKEELADTLFKKQKDAFETVNKLTQENNTEEQEVAFFYITSNGMVNVRKSGDYVPKMIELAGAKYAFSNLSDETETSSINITIEQFYKEAKDSDYLIYNSTTGSNISSLKELVGSNPVLADFNAVQNGNVFCITQNLYQKPTEAGTFITDLHNMLSEGKEDEFKFLYRLK